MRWVHSTIDSKVEDGVLGEVGDSGVLNGVSFLHAQ